MSETETFGRHGGRIHDYAETRLGLSFAVMASADGAVGMQIYAAGGTYVTSIAADVAARLGRLLIAASDDAAVARALNESRTCSVQGCGRAVGDCPHAAGLTTGSGQNSGKVRDECACAVIGDCDICAPQGEDAGDDDFDRNACPGCGGNCQAACR